MGDRDNQKRKNVTTVHRVRLDKSEDLAVSKEIAIGITVCRNGGGHFV